MKTDPDEYYTRESPYMPTLTIKSSVFKQKKFPDNQLSQGLVEIYQKLRSKTNQVHQSERSKNLIPIDQQRFGQNSIIKIRSPIRSNQSARQKSYLSNQMTSLQKHSSTETINDYSDQLYDQSQGLPKSISIQQYSLQQESKSGNKPNISLKFKNTFYNNQSLPQIADQSFAKNSIQDILSQKTFSEYAPHSISKMSAQSTKYQTEQLKDTLREKKKTKNDFFARPLSKESEIELQKQEVLILKRRRFNINQRQNAIKFLHFGKRWQELTAEKNLLDNYSAKKEREYIVKQCSIFYGTSKSWCWQ